jgi:redox-sensing transcriptional repressor
VTAPRITLLGRQGCHLCDEARSVISRVADDLGVTWEERDITQSEAELREYWDKIPVTLVDGVQHDFWRVSEDRLRRALRLSAGSPEGHQQPAPRGWRRRLCALVHKRRMVEGRAHSVLQTDQRGSRAGLARHRAEPSVERRMSSAAELSDPVAESGAGADRPDSGGIPEATVNRLPVYLRALYTLADRGVNTVASDELARAAGVNSAKLRKDLSHLGSYGIRGVGYDVEYLVYQVSRALGLTQRWPVVIVGAGNLGRALANYGGFLSRGFHIEAVLDSDAGLVGRQLGGVLVRHVSELESLVTEHGVAIGVIAVPAGAAQAMCDRLVAAGVTSILNFAPVVLNVPDGVDVRKVDLSIELQILAFHAQRRNAARFGQADQAAAEV